MGACCLPHEFIGEFHSPLPEGTHLLNAKKAKPLSPGLVFSFTTKDKFVIAVIFGVFGSGVISYPPNSNVDFKLLECKQF